MIVSFNRLDLKIFFQPNLKNKKNCPSIKLKTINLRSEFTYPLLQNKINFNIIYMSNAL
jgi:hypothetical protein